MLHKYFCLCSYRPDRSRVPRVNNVLNIILKCVAHPHRTCIYARGKRDCNVDLYATRPVRPISRAPDGRFVLSSSRSSSISSSIDDGGFLTHPAFRDLVVARSQPATLSLQHDLSSHRSEISTDSRNVPQGQTPHTAVSVIYSAHTPFLSSSPASTVWSPLMSPNYFSDLSSVHHPSSGERTLRSTHDQFSNELPSLEVIREENERILNSYSPSKVIRPRFPKLPNRHTRYTRSAPELVSIPPETSPESRSSSSGLGSKNTSHQTGSTGTAEWRLPPYRHPPPPPPPPQIPSTPGVAAKPQCLRTWLDYTPSPTHSVTSNKPLSVDDHYEFDSIFPASPTPTELVLTPLPATFRTKSTLSPLKHDDIEARVQAMKEEFHEYKKRQAQMKRLKELESIC